MKSLCVMIIGLISILIVTGCDSSGSSGDNIVDGDQEQDIPVVDGDVDDDESEDAEENGDIGCMESVQLGLEDNILDFGAVSVGADQSKSFTITADPPTIIKSLSIFDDDETNEYSITVGTCTNEIQGICHEATVNENASNTSPYTVTISYIPRDADLTHDDAWLQIETEDDCEDTKRVKLTSQCKGTPNLRLSIDDQVITGNDSIFFETVLPNSSADPVTFKLENTGETSANAPVWVKLDPNNQFADYFEWTDCDSVELTSTGFLIGSGEEKVCTLNFREKATPGEYTGMVSVSWNSSCQEIDGKLDLTLSGHVAECEILVTPDPTLRLGEAIANEERVRDHFTITNACPFDMYWTACALETGMDFSADCPTGRTKLEPDDSTTLDISFQPTQADCQLDHLILTFEREGGEGVQTHVRDVAGCGTPCTYPGCCPPDSDNCQPGDYRCEGQERQTCNTVCYWTTVEECAENETCLAVECVPGCFDGQRQCDGPKKLVCEEGDFVSDGICDDQNPCTTDYCTLDEQDPDHCYTVNLPNGSVCDDGDSETSNTECQDGQCIEVFECTDDGECCIDGEIVNVAGACTDDGNDCTDDECGDTGVCTHPNKAPGATCGDQTETTCSAPDTCDGTGTCQPNHASDQTECRPEAEGILCDVAEYCPGDGPDCPEDGYKSDQTVCRPEAESSLCDVAEYCTGDGPDCPVDSFKAETISCRAANDSECDIEDFCPGDSADCPDSKSTDICRAAVDDCDFTEMCDGVNDDCPENDIMDDGEVCGEADENQCYQGVCVDCVDDYGCTDLEDDSLECSEPSCDTENHTCEHQLTAHEGETCGETTSSICDDEDTCDADGICQANHKPTDTPCRPSEGLCDVVEYCVEGGVCPEDGFKTGDVVCRESEGECDLEELCTGDAAACPEDAKSTAECRAATNECDLAEVCNGVSDDCPGDEAKDDGEVCGAGDQCVAGFCEDCWDGTGCEDLPWGVRDSDCSERVCGTGNICEFNDGTDGAVCGTDDQCVVGACRDCHTVEGGCNDLAWDGRDTECAIQFCREDYLCDFTTEDTGTVCDLLATGDQDQCDGSGMCVDCVNVDGCGDLADDENPCTDLACVSNICNHEPDDENTCSLGTSCTTDACEDGACVPTEITSGCYIEGICVADGEKKSQTGDNSCRVCDSSNLEGWTLLENGEECDDGDDGTTNDTCGSGGVCLGCTPDCNGKECGDNGCGGSCDECADGMYCYNNLCYNNFGIPATGQNSCYDDSTEMTCPGVAGDNDCSGTQYCGQDFQYQYNTSAFQSINDDGYEIIYDPVTKLYWTKQVYYSYYDWFSNYCSNLADSNYANIADWRTPNLNEVLSIISFGDLESRQFPGDPLSTGFDFWIDDGDTTISKWGETYDLNLEANGYCVSGREFLSSSAEEFEYNEEVPTEPTYFHISSGLEWQAYDATSLNWQEALAYCEGLAYAGHSDWRLPNVNELASLLDKQEYPNHYFAQIPYRSGKHWTSTTLMQDNSEAMVIELSCGEINENSLSFYKSDDNYNAKCVRGSSCLPNCYEKQCGDDGCGGSCGECTGDEYCTDEGLCENNWVPISSGSFWMGSPDGCPGPSGYPGDCTEELGRTLVGLEDEALHQVTLTNGFAMSRFEATQEEFRDVMGWNPSYYSNKGGGQNCGSDCPVESVTWFDAIAYANQLSIREDYEACYTLTNVRCEVGGDVGTDYMECYDYTPGEDGIWQGISTADVSLNGVNTPYDCVGYRLPTEAEWEYSIRAGSTTAFYPSEGNDGTITNTNNDPNANQIAVNNKAHDAGPEPKGTLEPNAWGLYDMSGNVREWVWDNYCREYELIDSIDPDAHQCLIESGKVLRNGHFFSGPSVLRSAHRDHNGVGGSSAEIGFRLAQTCSCLDKECGFDQCGNECGVGCAPNEICNLDGQCEATEPPEAISLKDEAVVIPDDIADDAILPPDGPCGEMTFPYVGGLPPFDVSIGDTIVSGYDGGFLCNVLDVADNGSELVLSTVQGSLEDIIESGTLDFRVPISLSDPETKSTKGLTINRIKLYSNNGFEIELRPGSVQFDSEFHARIDYEWGEGIYFLGTASGTMTTDFGVDVTFPGVDIIRDKTTIAPAITIPFHFLVGSLPVSGKIILTLQARFEVSANGPKLSFGSRKVRTMTVGAEYRDHAWRDVEVKRQVSTEKYGPDIEEVGSIESEVGVDLNVKLVLYETAAPWITIGPRLDNDMIFYPNYSYDWQIGNCLDAYFGGDLLILGRRIAKYEHELFDICFNHESFPGCIDQCLTPRLTCTTPGTVEGCGEADDGDNCLDWVYKECNVYQTCQDGECVGECTSGLCCDTGTETYKAAGTACGSESTQYVCLDGTGCGSDITRQVNTQRCTGNSADCVGNWSGWSTDGTIACDAVQKCVPNQSYCSSCSTDACVDGLCCNTNTTPNEFKPSSEMCGPAEDWDYVCPDGTACGDDVYIEYSDRYCSGTSSTCNGELIARGESEHFAYCSSTKRCSKGSRTCVPCSCSSNWCQDNDEGSGTHCKDDGTTVTCGTSGSCYIETDSTPCASGTSCVQGECQNDCQDICDGRCGTVGDCDCDCEDGWACDPDGYCLDCSSGDLGFRDCDDFVHQREGELYSGNTPVDTVGGCSPAGNPGWHDGPTVNNLNIRWTWTTDCDVPPYGGNPYYYDGENARWTFSVPVDGYYDIDVKIPAVGYLCDNMANIRHADDVYYGLRKSGGSDPVWGPYDTSDYKGHWMTVTWSPTFLEAGEHTLILYDHGSTGVDCIDGTGSRWVFVDSVRVLWNH